MEIKNEPTVAIIACCKMEELYIREWLDWHFNIVGIDHIFLCDNNDIDYHIQLKDVIQDYINNGKVTLLDYRNIFCVQIFCYNEVYEKYGYNYDWFVIIDIDEYLYLPMFNNKIKDLLSKNSLDSVIYFFIFGKIYGDNNLIEYENIPCQERFKTPIDIKKFNSLDLKYRLWAYLTKSIFKGRGLIKKIKYSEVSLNITNQHDVFSSYHDIPRRDIFGNEFTKHEPSIHYIIPSDSYNCNDEEYLNKSYNVCHFKHYYTKSLEEYIKYKILRGDTLLSKSDIKYPYKINHYFIFNKYTKDKIDYIKTNYPELLNKKIDYLWK